jgi:hypothetical protein
VPDSTNTAIESISAEASASVARVNGEPVVGGERHPVDGGAGGGQGDRAGGGDPDRLLPTQPPDTGVQLLLGHQVGGTGGVARVDGTLAVEVDPLEELG